MGAAGDNCIHNQGQFRVLRSGWDRVGVESGYQVGAGSTAKFLNLVRVQVLVGDRCF